MTHKHTKSLSGTCIDVLPDKVPHVAAAPMGALELALPISKLWDAGRVLKFHFLNGTLEQKQAFKESASKWAEHTNLIMLFDTSINSAEFRVQFSIVGNWSLVGLDNLSRSAPDATMSIQDMSSVLHEVGHAIGCIHEHSNPASSIKWNKPVVYTALGGEPNNWDHEMVDKNVFQKYDSKLTQFSVFDPKSIMLYFFPSTWTLDGVGTSSNDVLSKTDKAFIRRSYPGCTVDFSKPEIAAGGCVVSHGPRVFFNQQYGNSWVMNHPNKSFIELNFDQPKTYSGADIYQTAKLKLKHLCSKLPSESGHAPIDILINGKIFQQDYSPTSENYIKDEWDITSYLKDGPNTLRINFKDAKSNYWIRKLQIECV